MANECIPLYRPGADLTFQASANVVGKTFVNITGAVNATTGALGSVGPCAAAAKAIGVASYDAPAGTRVPVIMGPGHIVPVTCGAAITAGAEVEVGSNAKAVTLASGKPVGRALSTTSAADTDVFVRLY